MWNIYNDSDVSVIKFKISFKRWSNFIYDYSDIAIYNFIFSNFIFNLFCNLRFPKSHYHKIMLIYWIMVIWRNTNWNKIERNIFLTFAIKISVTDVEKWDTVPDLLFPPPPSLFVPSTTSFISRNSFKFYIFRGYIFHLGDYSRWLSYSVSRKKKKKKANAQNIEHFITKLALDFIFRKAPCNSRTTELG